jgi:group I intron endonuclease
MEENKVSIYKENKGKSGIYRFINRISGKQYIGSAKDLKARFAHYYSVKAIANDNMPICKAMLKYG